MAGNITRLPTPFSYTPSITHTDMGERGGSVEGMETLYRLSSITIQHSEH